MASSPSNHLDFCLVSQSFVAPASWLSRASERHKKSKKDFVSNNSSTLKILLPTTKDYALTLYYYCYQHLHLLSFQRLRQQEGMPFYGGREHQTVGSPPLPICAGKGGPFCMSMFSMRMCDLKTPCRKFTSFRLCESGHSTSVAGSGCRQAAAAAAAACSTYSKTKAY